MKPGPRFLDRTPEVCRRGPSPAALAVIASLAAGPAHALDAAGTTPPDRETLRRAWHRCVRQEFSGQPGAVERQAAQRAALAACKSAEDAYVAAELAARQARGDEADRAGTTSRARAWIASVGSSVGSTIVDPIASWFGLGR